MQMRRRKAGVVLMSLMLALTSFPVSAADAEAGKEAQDEIVLPEESQIEGTADAKDADEDSGAPGAASEEDGQIQDVPAGEGGGLSDAPSKTGGEQKDAGDGGKEDVGMKAAAAPQGYDLSADNVELRLKDGQAEYEYTGSEIRPEVEVVVKQDAFAGAGSPEQVISPEHYTIKYADNIEAGEASVWLLEKESPGADDDPAAGDAGSAEDAMEPEDGEKPEDIQGIKKIQFRIVQADLTKCTLEAPKAANYTGKQVEPDVALVWQEKKLEKDKDYKLTYSDNTKIGTAGILIEGTGNFKGSRTAQFKIRFGTPEVTVSSSYSAIKLKWGKIKDAAGYEVYRSASKSGEFKKLKTIKSGSQVSYSDTQPKFGKTYYYKVRSYKNVKENKKTKKENSAWSEVIGAKKQLGKATVSSAKCASETTAKITWKSVSGAQGYEIYKSAEKNGEYDYAGKVSSAGKVTYTATKLKAGVTYYFKVRAFCKVDAKTYYGAFSSAKQETFTSGQKLYSLFPGGVPTSKAQMEKYLVKITVPIKDVNGTPGTMQLEVHKDLTKEFMGAFQDMYAINFPVRASDTYAFSWRSMVSGKNRSHHSYGVVVDLNSSSNPMIGVTSGKYQPGVDPYSVTEEVVAIWKKHGFFWGGDWTSSKDYMHFTYTDH